MIIRRAGISHSKYRNSFALVYIECDTEKKEIVVMATSQWSRTHINTIANDVSSYYRQLLWEVLFIDQITGEHLINDLKLLEIPLKVINLQRELKDPDNIDKVKVMDIKEHVQFMIYLNTEHRIKFPQEMTPDLKELWDQSKTFQEHKTEQGSIDYRSEGEALDDMVRALLIACFSVRKFIMGNNLDHVAGSFAPIPQGNNLEDLIVIREEALEGII